MKTNDDLIAHMRSVGAAERDLRDLGVVWQMIESSAAISCPDEVAPILPTLIQTRERFTRLQQQLIERMAGEYRAELADDLTAKAQCAIDILVRNLYERTADVGFLATDDVVRRCCAEPVDAAADPAAHAAVVQRLRDYQAKYTVYDDIVLLGTDGRVLARMDPRAHITHSSDPIVAAALQASGHVERYVCSDLADGEAPALLYAHRIVGEHDGRPLGVLVLRFRFQDEMQRIFHDVADERHQMALMLLDDEHRVVASNDTAHVPLGARMRPVPAGEVMLTTFAGREYLAVLCASHGYQGYPGPGWRAQAMVSLLTAFRAREGDDLSEQGDVPLDNTELQTLGREADAINRDLRRVVWNGRLGSSRSSASDMGRAPSVDAARLKAVLAQVNTAGYRTRDRVERATRELYRTALARTRHQAADLARLAADVMDRNLYERANDCRWWAQSPAIRQALVGLSAGGDAVELQASLNRVLDHINGLYTVYSRLVVFDANGVVCGLSRSGEAGDLLGRAVDPRWQDQVRGLTDPQHYAVSRFEATNLHEHGETYVYLAAIRAEDDRQRLLGGIAIVFHSARELQSMLREILGDRSGIAAFVDTEGRVLATSDAASTGGRLIDFTGEQALVEHDGTHYACARVRGGGYREFKRSDGYDNGVSAIVALRLGSTERRRSSLSDQQLLVPPVADRRWSTDVAVFQVSAARYALPAESVFAALAPTGLVRARHAHPLSIGLMEVPGDGERPRLVQVISARRHFGVAHPPRATDGVVLVLRSPQCPDLPALGLLVDDVLAVVAVDRRRLHPAPQGMPQFAPWVAGMLDCEVQGSDAAQPVLLQLLDPRRICAELHGPADAPDPWSRELPAPGTEPRRQAACAA